MKKIFAATFLLIIFGLVFVSGMLTEFHIQKEIVSPLPYPTGYEVFKELNIYRESLGLPDLILYQPLCNNIAKRWQHYKDYNNHDGLQEFVDEFQSGIRVSEIFAPGITAQDTVQNWKNSPSHDGYIKGNSKVCVYSSDNLSVALLSN